MYVGALAMNTTEKSLTDYFSQFGDVSNCQVGRTFFTSRLGLVRTYPFFTAHAAFSQRYTLNLVLEHFLATKNLKSKF
jgi:hypothetical protein